MCPVRRRDARRDTLAGLNTLCKGRPKTRSIVLRHRPQPQIVGSLLGQRQTDQSASKLRHEVDRLGSHELGRQGQVTFVLAVLVVDHDDHPPRLDLFDRLKNRSKHPLPSASLANSLRMTASVPDPMSFNHTWAQKRAAHFRAALSFSHIYLQRRLNLKSPGLQ